MRRRKPRPLKAPPRAPPGLPSCPAVVAVAPATEVAVMEGESTLGLVSGFVLGALTFQHLNTDSDTVSRARGCRHCPQLPLAVRARGRGRPPGSHPGPFDLVKPGRVGKFPAAEGSPREVGPLSHLTTRPLLGVLAPLPARSACARLVSGGPAGLTPLPAAGSWPTWHCKAQLLPVLFSVTNAALSSIRSVNTFLKLLPTFEDTE